MPIVPAPHEQREHRDHHLLLHRLVRAVEGEEEAELVEGLEVGGEEEQWVERGEGGYQG